MARKSGEMRRRNSREKRARLESFARTAEAVAATTKKLEKAALLGAYCDELTDEDLARAARYFAGHQFAMNDARTTNVGTGVLRDALSEATGLSVENLRPRYVRLGDSGEVAYEAVLETRAKGSALAHARRDRIARRAPERDARDEE